MVANRVFGLEMWLKIDCPSTPGGGRLTLFSYASPDDGISFSVGYQCPVGTTSLDVILSHGQYSETVNFDTILWTDMEWHHLGLNVEGSPDDASTWMEFSLDGEPQGWLGIPTIAFPCPVSGGSVILGQGQSGENTLDVQPVFEYTVFMSEVRLWSIWASFDHWNVR
jgi:hypothetical protein